VPTADGRHTLPRRLRQRWAATPLGFDPSVQLLSTEDFLRGVERAVETRAGGLFHLHPRQAIPLRKALKAAGVARLPVPGSLLGLVRRPQLDYLRHSWTVGSERAAAELGFEPRHSSAQALAKSPPARDENHDAFGEERAYIDRLGKAFFPFLRKIYWRIEHEGIKHVPRHGRGVLTGVHRGFMPWDGVMALHLLARERQRYPRFLLHPCLLKFPFLAPYMTRLGGLPACQENADWVLQRDEILGIFPEGIRGAFTPYRRAYQLGRFGRDEYVRMALRNGAPILPFVTVGSAEIFPILGGFRWAWVRRWTEWPYLPVTASLPGIPNPSKWHTRFLEPLPVHLTHGPEAAADAGLVRAISGEVQQRMRQALDEMLARRRWIFFGSIFDSAVDPTSDATAGSAGASVLPAALPGDPKA
jgi:1-acyl-sn-glycerol-3-phosphate acyltransferase